MKNELSNAGKDALVSKGIEDGKDGKYNPPNSTGILESAYSSIMDSKETQEKEKQENDAYNEGHSIGRKTR